MKTLSRFTWALLLAVLVPSLALADARLEARKRFKQGMALIAEGRLDEGIDQLLEAYAVKPHPNVLFNVAKAYEAAGQVQPALTYYRRYLAFKPADSTDVTRAIARLEAQLPPPAEPTPPPKPTRPEPEPSRPTPGGGGATVDPALLAKLESLTGRLESALAKSEAREKEPVATSAGKGDDLPAPDDEAAAQATDEAPYEETVVTASRRAQSTLEAPNATTIITAEEIRLSGATNLPELLRRVPGAEVMAMGVSSHNVSFRGFNQRVSNKVLVLLDGRTEYQDFLGGTVWPAIPIGLEEIERIEVIRGPGSAIYGANAMLGVINIITRAPGTGPKATLSGFVGNARTAGGSLVASGGDKLKFRASAGFQQADKYSRDYDEGRPDVVSAFADPNLGLRSARGNLVLRYAFNKDFSASVSGGINRLFTEFYAIGLLRNYFLDATSGFAQADVQLGPVKVKAFWNHLTVDPAGPQYTVVGQRSLLTRVESNVFDVEALFQKDFQLLGEHRLNIGVAGRLKRLGWDYLGALRQELHANAFIQEQWKPLRSLQFVGSYRVDRHPLLDQGLPGYAHSPQISMLWRPVESQALRASFSTAFRQPTFLESYMDLRIPLPGVPGASVLTQGERALRPERLLAFEIGWRGELAKVGLEYEVAAYWNIVSDLIVLSAVNPLPAGEAFDPQSQTYLRGRSVFLNDPIAYTARGGEVGARWAIVDGLTLRLSAAFQQVTADLPPGTPCGACTQAPAAKVFAGVTYRTPVDLDLGVDAAFTSSTIWVEREPDPVDPTRITNPANPVSGSVVINARVGYRLFKDKVTLAVVGSQLGPSHSEHPFGNQINRRIFATVSVTP